MKKLIGVVLILFVLLTPWLWQLFKPADVVNVAIIDAGSNDEQMMERVGITEALNIAKVQNEAGENYDPSTDYYGVTVSNHKENIAFNELPMRYDTYDMIYLSNTYGLNESELAWGDEKSTRTLYGGLSNNAWRNIKARLEQSSPVTLIVEHDNLSIHTSEGVREDLAETLGISYSGWKAKYFEDLAEWNQTLNGNGIVFYHEAEDKSIVLDGAPEVTLKTTSAGQALFGFNESKSYYGWMDISEATESEVLAHFNLNLSEEHQSVLAENNIPSAFVAAAYRAEEGNKLYYFAGNFSGERESRLYSLF